MRRAPLVVLSATLLAMGLPSVLAPASAAPADVEAMVLTAINTGRAGVGKPALVLHTGLRTRQREHAQYMASIDMLTHDGVETRVQTAPPDPAEGNGAPDDGFTGSYCENLAFRMMPGETEAQIAQGFYTQWFESTSGHRECMLDATDSGRNVAGVGVFQDASGGWWAAFLLVLDNTPPTGSSPPPPTVSPGNPAPVFGPGSPCGGVQMTPWLSGPGQIDVSATDTADQSVTLTPSGLPSFATFESTPGNPATGRFRVMPGFFDWLGGITGPAIVVTITATDNGTSPSAAACPITIRVPLFAGSPI